MNQYYHPSAEYDLVECEVAGFPPTAYEIQVRQRGNYVVAVFRMNIEGWGNIVIRARVSLEKIQQILFRKYRGTIAGYAYDDYVMEGFFDDLAKGALDIGKKIVRSKVFKAAGKVLQHPAVLAVSQVIPGLNAVVPAAAMITKGLAMTDALTRARKGSKPDMHTIKKAIHIAKKGKGKKAIRAAKLLRMADKMSWAPSVAKQVAPAAEAIAKKTGAPPEVVKAAVEKAVKVDVPRPPPAVSARKRRLIKAAKRRKLAKQKKKFLLKQKKARQYFLRTGRWPRGFDPRRPMLVPGRRPKRRPRTPYPQPGMMQPYGPPPRMAPYYPPPRPPWQPSYPQYY